MLITDAQIYDTATWIVIMLINVAIIFIGYLLWRVARQPVQAKARLFLRASAVIAWVTAVIRAITVLFFYDNMSIKLALPITSAVAWIVIASACYVTVRIIESAVKRVRAQNRFSHENVKLMNAVMEDVVVPAINGELVPRSRVEMYRQKSIAFAEQR